MSNDCEFFGCGVHVKVCITEVCYNNFVISGFENVLISHFSILNSHDNCEVFRSINHEFDKSCSVFVNGDCYCYVIVNYFNISIYVCVFDWSSFDSEFYIGCIGVKVIVTQISCLDCVIAREQYGVNNCLTLINFGINDVSIQIKLDKASGGTVDSNSHVYFITIYNNISSHCSVCFNMVGYGECFLGGVRIES